MIKKSPIQQNESSKLNRTVNSLKIVPKRFKESICTVPALGSIAFNFLLDEISKKKKKKFQCYQVIKQLKLKEVDIM